MTVEFTVKVDAEIPLSPLEVWPDGDGPENPTAKDVAEVMGQDGLRRLLVAWGFDRYLHITVNGEHVHA